MTKFLKTKAYDRDGMIIGKDEADIGYHSTIGTYLLVVPFGIVLLGLALWFGSDIAHAQMCTVSPDYGQDEICPANYTKYAVYARGAAIAAWIGGAILFLRAATNVKKNWRKWKDEDCYCFACLRDQGIDGETVQAQRDARMNTGKLKFK